MHVMKETLVASGAPKHEARAGIPKQRQVRHIQMLNERAHVDFAARQWQVTLMTVPSWGMS